MASFSGQRDSWTVLVDKDAGGQLWWKKRQVDSLGGQRGRWLILVDKETVGQFW